VENAAEHEKGGELSTRLAEVMAARDAVLQGHLAASTLVTVPALARPEWRMEIAVVAAR
jgi:enamine deaminase RidA (YjgF/YER057c/UK114 family)